MCMCQENARRDKSVVCILHFMAANKEGNVIALCNLDEVVLLL